MALTAPRDTKTREPKHRVVTVASGATCYQGGIVTLDGATAKPGATATGRVAIGIATHTATAGEKLRVERGCYRFDNSEDSDAITVADIGSECWIVNDHQVAKTGAVVEGAATRSKAGRVFDVDAGGVWVEIG